VHCILAARLAGKVNLGVDYPHMPGKRVTARESLLLSAELAADLHFARVVNSILVPCKIVGPRELSVARLACRSTSVRDIVRMLRTREM